MRRLSHLAARLETHLALIDESVDNCLLGARALERREKWALQEGYLSQKWQAWGGFCRALCLYSTLGAVDATGATTTSAYSARSESELAWIAARASQQASYANVRSLAGPHLEPTWGDLGKFSLIISALAPSNQTTVLSGVLAAGSAARHLQIVRNATAHLSTASVPDVMAIAIDYLPTRLAAPSDAMLWEERTTRDFAYRAWSRRLVASAQIAVQ